MNHLSDSIRTKETYKLLQQLDEVLAQRGQLNFSEAMEGPRLDQIVRDIDRARRQFDSRLFFVVIFGSLKAGKSTLTNTLAGEYVSPSGFGIETTRRPSLVIRAKAAEQSGIDQYFSNDPDVNHFFSQRRLRKSSASIVLDNEAETLAKVHEAFDAVADYLRGIRHEKELQGRIRRDTLPLTPEILKAELTKDLPTEPLLTVIRCKGGHLLSEGVAVVDMPGLDGSRSNWREDPIHEWVIKRAEFFLFVQSSVAALNNETHDFLREIVAQSAKPPIWLVQNIFDARYWQPEEKREKDADDQRAEGEKQILMLLNEAPHAVLKLNIGLAWDGKNEGQNEWLAKSEFLKFEAGLTKVLQGQRALIQERNCLENLRQRANQAKRQLDDIKQCAQTIKGHQKQVQTKVKSAKDLLDVVDYKTDWENALRGEISTIAEVATKPWLDSLENEVGALRERHDRETTGKKVNNELANVAVRLASEGANKHFAKTLLLPHYVKVANQYCKSAENDAVSRCNELLRELKLPELPAPIPPMVEDLPLLPHDSFRTDKLRETPQWNPLWNTEHEGHTIVSHIELLAKDWGRQIHARKDGWVKQVFNNHFSTYCKTRREHYRAHLQRLMADSDAIAKPKEEAATVTENLIDQMNEALRNLELPLANAAASMKMK